MEFIVHYVNIEQGGHMVQTNLNYDGSDAKIIDMVKEKKEKRMNNKYIQNSI